LSFYLTSCTVPLKRLASSNFMEIQLVYGLSKAQTVVNSILKKAHTVCPINGLQVQGFVHDQRHTLRYNFFMDYDLSRLSHNDLS